MSYPLFPLAGFQVTIHGRFWVGPALKDRRQIDLVAVINDSLVINDLG